MRGRIEAVLDWAKVRSYPRRERIRLAGEDISTISCRRGPSCGLSILPACLTQRSVLYGRFARAKHLGARALEFTILTAGKNGEALGVTWDEIDLEPRFGRSKPSV